MKFRAFIILISSFCLLMHAKAEPNNWQEIENTGSLTFITSRYAPFPHPARTHGHTYQDSLYTFAEHYNDSSVAIFIPRGFRTKGAVDLVFYLHGWSNNIRKALDQFDLLKQFKDSGRNAVLVFPEGPKNAPDSFGGRLEDKGDFSGLVNDVLHMLFMEKMIPEPQAGKIVLAGHSGAYHVIAGILNRGGMTGHISDVFLFDALYGQLEKYGHWITGYHGRLVNIITPEGGTKQESEDFLQDFEDWQVAYQRINANTIGDGQLSANRIVFMFTTLQHREVVNPYFNQFLRTSSLEPVPEPKK